MRAAGTVRPSQEYITGVPPWSQRLSKTKKAGRTLPCPFSCMKPPAAGLSRDPAVAELRGAPCPVGGGAGDHLPRQERIGGRHTAVPDPVQIGGDSDRAQPFPAF